MKNLYYTLLIIKGKKDEKEKKKDWKKAFLKCWYGFYNRQFIFLSNFSKICNVFTFKWKT